VFPYRELAAEVTELWRSETHTRLRYAAGAFDWVNAISFYSEDHPSSFADLNFGSALWITPTELRRNGVVIICASEDAQCRIKAGKFLTDGWKQFPIRISRRSGSRKMPVYALEIYVVPPDPRA